MCYGHCQEKREIFLQKKIFKRKAWLGEILAYSWNLRGMPGSGRDSSGGLDCKLSDRCTAKENRSD